MSRRDEKYAFVNHDSTSSHAPLLKILQKLGLIENEQVQKGALFNDSLPVAYFANCGMYSEWEAVQAVAKELHLPCQRLTADDQARAQLLMTQPPCSAVAESVWMKIRAVPITATDDYVKVVLANPLDLEGVKALEFELQNPVRSVIGLESEILTALRNAGEASLALDTSTFDAKRDGLEFRTATGTSSELNSKIVGESSALALKGVKPIGKRRVLLVDDDEDIRAVLTALLEQSMYEVIQAADGRAALEAVYASAPEIVVCDLMMPKMNGRDFVQALRNDTRTKNIPVIMLTAASTEDNELELIKSGADDFVSKTAKSDILLARVSRLLGRAAK